MPANPASIQKEENISLLHQNGLSTYTKNRFTSIQLSNFECSNYSTFTHSKLFGGTICGLENQIAHWMKIKVPLCIEYVAIK